MKRILLFVAMAATGVLALERQQLMPLIVEASKNRGSVYLEVRDRIVGYGSNAIPILACVAVDEAMPWQQQLIARICFERIERKNDIEKLITTDWYKHPKFNPEWREFLSGPESHMHDMVVTELNEVGLWYYYLELEWKMTDERARLQKDEGRNRNRYRWASWCTFAVKDSPEERIWFLRICFELMANPDVYYPRVEHLFNFLVREKKPDAVPLIFQYLSKQKNKGGDFDSWFFDVLKYADTRSADTLETFVVEHKYPYDLTPQLAAVRARRAPPTVSMPLFRLGTNIVKTTKQP